MSSPPPCKRRRSQRTSSERQCHTKTTTTTRDDVTGRASKRSTRKRCLRSPIPCQDENSITSSSTLNTAFIDAADTDLKWQPDISAVLPHDVIRRNTGSGRKPEVVAVAGQLSSCERKFVDDVSDVVCRLSRPLLRRHDVMTSCQHSVLFQNMEKVCTCSRYLSAIRKVLRSPNTSLSLYDHQSFQPFAKTNVDDDDDEIAYFTLR